MRTAVAALAIVSIAAAQEDLTKLYSEAQQAQAAGDLATAARRYEVIVQQRPQMAEAYANLGNLYYQQGQANRAKSVYQKAIHLKPELAGPHFFLGVIAFDEHDYSAALTDLNRAEALQASNPLIYSYLGYTRYARSEFRKAAAELEKAAALNPADIDVLYHLGKSYSHLAGDSLSQLQKQFPDSAYITQARAHLDAPPAYKDSPPAGVHLRDEMGRWQSKVHALPNPPRTDQDLYRTAEGFQILSYLSSLAVFELDPDSYRSHQLRAQVLEESNNEEGAIAEYRETLKRKPNLPNIHFAIGSLYWKDQKFDEAWTELQAELRTNPDHAQALYELADICAFQSHAPEAEKYYLAALKLDPSMTEARFGIEKIYTESGRYEKSLVQLRAVLQADSSNPTAHYRFALVYRKMGRPRDAGRELAIFNQHRPPSSQGSSMGK
jgi:tetratricopeptide (TPR) repeat protein